MQPTQQVTQMGDSGVVLGQPTDALRELYELADAQKAIRDILHAERGLTLLPVTDGRETIYHQPGQFSHQFATAPDCGLILRFVGVGSGTLYVEQQPIGAVCGSAWAYVPPGGLAICYGVDAQAAGGLKVQIVGVASY